MPLYNLPIEEINESVSRPIAINVVRDIIDRMGLPPDIPLIFKGNASQFLYNASEFSKQSYNLRDHNRYQGDAALTIEYTDEDNELNLLNGAVWRPEQRAVFHDPALNVSIFPSFVSKKAEISISLTGTEKQVERWRATMRRKVTQGVIDLNHMVSYHYPIPTFYMIVLLNIFKLRENVAGYNDGKVGDWLKKHFIDSYSVITNAAGNGSLFVIREKQLPIQGWFDFGTTPPKAEKDADVTRYSLSFTYSYYYDQPETMSMRCPLVVHNQMLPPEFIKTNRIPFELDYIIKTGSFSQLALDRFRFNTVKTSHVLRRPGVPIPFFDDWLGDTRGPSAYQTLIRPLIKLNPSDKKDILNLDQLGDWSINPIARHYILQCGPMKLTRPFKNLFTVGLYSWDQYRDQSKITIDNSLNIRYTEDLDLRDMHHLVLSLLWDITQLDPEGMEDLRNHPCMFKYWLSLVAPDLLIKYGLDLGNCAIDPGSDKDPIPDDVFKEIIEDLDKGNDLKHGSDEQKWQLVAGFSIIAHRFKEGLANVERY